LWVREWSMVRMLNHYPMAVNLATAGTVGSTRSFAVTDLQCRRMGRQFTVPVIEVIEVFERT